MENIDNFDPTLFIRPDGLPMVFLLLPGRSSEDFYESIKTDVELRGGIVLDQRDSQYSDNLIHLLGKNEVPMRTAEMFTYQDSCHVYVSGQLSCLHMRTAEMK